MVKNKPERQNLFPSTSEGRRIRDTYTQTLIDLDLSATELMILTKFPDPELDFHTARAARDNGVAPEDVTPEMRRRAKELNYLRMYGE